MKLGDTCTISGLAWTRWEDPAGFGGQLTYVKLQGLVKIGDRKIHLQIQRSIPESAMQASHIDPVAMNKEIIKAQWLARLGKELFTDE